MLASVASTYEDIVTSVFSSTTAAKAWLATGAGILALVQVTTGARIFGKIARFVPVGPPTVNRIHRWSGRFAVLLTLPVAFHCIFILGFRSTDARVLAHSILGSLIYGFVAVKLFFVHDRDRLDLVGGLEPEHPREEEQHRLDRAANVLLLPEAVALALEGEVGEGDTIAAQRVDHDLRLRRRHDLVVEALQEDHGGPQPVGVCRG